MSLIVVMFYGTFHKKDQIWTQHRRIYFYFARSGNGWPVLPGICGYMYRVLLGRGVCFPGRIGIFDTKMGTSAASFILSMGTSFGHTVVSAITIYNGNLKYYDPQNSCMCTLN